MYTKELTLNVNKFTIGWAEYLEKKVAQLNKDGENWQKQLQNSKNPKNKISIFKFIRVLAKKDSHSGLFFTYFF